MFTTERGSVCIVLSIVSCHNRCFPPLRKFFCNIVQIRYIYIYFFHGSSRRGESGYISNNTERQSVLKRDSRASLRIANGDEGKGTEEKQKRSRRDEEEEEDARITGSRSAFSFQRTKRSFSGPSPRHIAPLSLSLSPLFSASSLSPSSLSFSISLYLSRRRNVPRGNAISSYPIALSASCRG